MSSTDELFQKAIGLSEAERADLAKRLLESLDEAGEPGEIERAWVQEIERRARDVLSGQARTIPAEEVFARARAHFQRR